MLSQERFQNTWITFLLWVTPSSGQALMSTKNVSRHSVPDLLPELGVLSSPALFLNKTHLAHERKKGSFMNKLHPQKVQHKGRHAKGRRQPKFLNQGKKLDRNGKG